MPPKREAVRFIDGVRPMAGRIPATLNKVWRALVCN
jgi:hypothetical protein